MINWVGDEFLSPSDPGNANSLLSMRSNLAGNYVLGSDVYAGGTIEWSDGGFAPIGSPGSPFSGRFVGLNNEIYDMTISRPGQTGVGLFGGLAGSVSDMLLTDFNVTGGNQVGTLAGAVAAGGSVSNVRASGSVIGGSQVGGLIGYANGDAASPISGSTFEGSIGGARHLGGIVGQFEPTNPASLTHASFSNSFYNRDAVTFNGASLTTAGALYADQYDMWSENGALSIGDYASSLPSSGGAHLITTEQGLRDMLGFASDPSLRFRIGANISVPDGFHIPLLGGELDGGSRTLSGLNVGNNSELGLVGRNLGMLSNLNLSGVAVSGGASDSYIGGAVGLNHGRVDRVTVAGSVAGGEMVGGVVGYNSSGASVTNSSAAVKLSGAFGGLVGANDGTIDTSDASGSVDGSLDTGGLVGRNGGIVSNSYSTADVSSGGGFSQALKALGPQSIGPLIGNDVVGGGVSGVTNSHYDIDSVTVNGAAQVSRGGLYGSQFQDWLSGGAGTDGPARLRGRAPGRQRAVVARHPRLRRPGGPELPAHRQHRPGRRPRPAHPLPGRPA